MPEPKPQDKEYAGTLEPTREVSSEIRKQWNDAGFTAAINGIEDIADVIAQLDIGVDDVGGVMVDLSYATSKFESLNGAIRESLLKMTMPENAEARRNLISVYPFFDFLLNQSPSSKAVFNYWVESVNKNIASPDGQLDFVKDLMQAFTNKNGEFVFEWAGDFGNEYPGLEDAAFKNTQKRLRAEYESQFSDKRSDSPPRTPNPWECMIGASRFYVPPVSINVSQNFKVSSLTGASIRQKASPKFNSGHSETMISMTLYFPNQDTIWGIGAEESLDIDFNTAEDYVIDNFMSSLRGLITQFKYAPFLPIKNAYINEAYGITGVAMQSMSISTVPDYPFCMAATLNMTSFNHKVFLPAIDDFSQAIHWGRYRQYIGKAAEKMSTELYAGYKVEDSSAGPIGSILGEAANDIVDTVGKILDPNSDEVQYDSVVGYDGFKFKGFDKKKEIEEGTQLSLYYPTKTPLQVFAPDMSEWRSQGEDQIFTDDKNIWDQFLGSFGVDVNKHKEFQYETLVNSYIPPSKNFSPLSAFVDFNNAIEQTIGTINSDDIESYIARTQQKYEEKNGKITQAIKDQISLDTYKDWVNLLYSNWKNTDFYKKYESIAKRQNAAFLLQEWDLPMDKLTFDTDSVIIDGVSVSMSNTFAKLQIQMQDEPAYQHIGSGDSQVSVSMTILGAENITRFRQLFNHINGLARLEQAHGVIGFLGIKNILAGISGIKYVMPLNFQVDTIEGYPNVYKVRLDLVDFDVFQQRREELSSDQQVELIKNFGKRNPFLRFKQLWGATNAYPDLPLSIRDKNGAIVGHLDPDFYFKAFQTIDDETVNYLPSQEFRINQDDEIKDDSPIYDQIDKALEAEREIGKSSHLMIDGTYREATEADLDLPVIPDVAVAYAWTDVKYTYTDGASLNYGISLGDDGIVAQDAGEYTTTTEGFDPKSSYTIYDYDGSVAGFYVPDGKGGHNISSNPGVAEAGTASLANAQAYGKGLEFHIDQHFPVPGELNETVATLRTTASGVIWGSTNEAGVFTPEADQVVRIGEDNPSKNMPENPIIEGNAPFTKHSNEYDKDAVNSYGQFEMMMKDTQYRNKAGRMIRAFPTYMLWLIDEGGSFAGVKLYDNFYGLSSIQDFSIHQSEDLVGDTLVLRVSNLYQKLTRPSEVYSSLGSAENPYKNEDGTGLIDLVYNRGRNLISGMTSDLDIIQIGNVRLKPGVRVHMRTGYSANPNALPTIFNGTITTVEEGQIVTVTAQSDTVELSALVNSSNKKGDSGGIDGGMMTNLWLSEPRDLMVTLLMQGVSTFKQTIAHATNGTIFSENRYGIRHFGHILYEALSDDESARASNTKEMVGKIFTDIGSPGKDALSTEDTQDLGFGASAGQSSIRDASLSVMGQMWSNLFAHRDYEIFKRNIYPGNGTGVAQFLGGDLMDGGEMLAIAGLRPDRNALLQKAGLEDTNDGLVPADPQAVDDAASDAISDGSADKDKSSTETSDGVSDWWQVGWSLLNTVPGAIVDNPAAAVDTINQVSNPAYGLVRNKNALADNPISKLFRLSGELTDDDMRGFDEVSFRAQTYMKSVWDLFRLCANLLPNYIVAVRPFEDRSTVFYGKPHWLYTSGVIPLTTGISKDYELPVEEADKTMTVLLNAAAKNANPIKDFQEQYKELSELASTTYTGSSQGTSPQVPEGAVVNSDSEDPSIMGPPSVTAAQIADWWLNDKKKPEPSFVDITTLAGYYIDLGKSEGVRGDLAFVQACNETGWFTAGYATQRYNFAGIGAYDSNPDNAFTYKTVQEGVIAHIQLLKRVVLGNDVEFSNSNYTVEAGTSPAPRWAGKQANTLNGLAGNWASSQAYGFVVGSIYRDLLSSVGADTQSNGSDNTKDYKKEEDEFFDKPENIQESIKKDIDKEKDFGAFDPDIQVWYPSSLYNDQSKNVGHAARMLYEKEYFDSKVKDEDPKPTFYALGDSDLIDASRSVDEANHVWRDLRRTFLDPNGNLSKDLYKTYFTKQHPVVLSVEELKKSGLYDDAMAEKPTDPGNGPLGFGKRIVRNTVGIVDDLLNVTGAVGQVVDLKDVVTDYEPDAYKTQEKMFYLYVNEVFPDSDDPSSNEKTIQKADDKLGIDELSTHFKNYEYLLIYFMRFLWYWSYNRAWVVLTADKKTDMSVAPWTDYDVDLPAWLGGDGKDNGDGNKIIYEFDRIKDLWVEFLDEYDNGKGELSELDQATQKNVIFSERLWEWMAGHNSEGNNTRNSVQKDIEDALGGATSAISELITASATALMGVVNLFRVQLMQLGMGLNMAGKMQRAANKLNSAFNDSIYYSAGEDGSILRLADNPFTREYGEPVVEIREPFQRIHYIDSFQHILANTITENTSNVFTTVTAVSDGNYPVTVYLDKGIPSSQQYETTIETGIYWDNPTGKGFFSILHPLLHPIETSRGIVKAATGSSDEILSKRIGLAHLKESLKDIYGGELWIIGNPDIRPHDLVYLSDVSARMYGMFEVEAITHHFTPDLGFVSAIVPNAVVTVNDPARWSLVSWIQGRFAMQTIRNDTRNLMLSRNVENSRFAASKDISLDELYQSLQVQFKGTVQHTQGSSALIKDLASIDHYGAAEYAEKQIQKDIKLSAEDMLVAGFLNMQTLGLAGKAWDYVKENLLDQQGCYIQYMTKDGSPMDAGLSYAQGVAVGRHHSKTLLPGILGMQVADVVDGHTRITKDDLLSELGWSEIDVAALRQDVSWWVNKTNDNILQLSAKSPDEVAFTPPTVHLARVTKVTDADTIEIKSFDSSDTWADSVKSIRLLGVAAPELLNKDHQGGVIDDPFTLIDETKFDEVTLNSPNNRARLGQEYLEEVLINKPGREGRVPVVAIRLNKYEDQTYGRTLGTIFHNAPASVKVEDIPDILYRLASKWPLIPWDSYMEDGRPYTANWSVISAGFANVDIGGISMMDYNNGGS